MLILSQEGKQSFDIKYFCFDIIYFYFDIKLFIVYFNTIEFGEIMLIKKELNTDDLLKESLHNVARDLEKDGIVSVPIVEAEKPFFGDVNYKYEGFQVKITQIEGIWTGLAFTKQGKIEINLKTPPFRHYEQAGKEINKLIDSFNRG